MKPPPLPSSAVYPDREDQNQCHNPVFFLGIFLAAVVYVGVVANFLLRVGLCFAPGPLNSTVLSFALLLPSAALTAIMRRCRGAELVLGLIVVGLPAIPSFFLACFLLVVGDPESYERLHEVQTGGYNVVVYQTDGGALTGKGICVRQELPLRFGLYLVRPIYDQARADDASVEVLGLNTVKIVSNSYPDPDPKTVHLRPLLGF